MREHSKTFMRELAPDVFKRKKMMPICCSYLQFARPCERSQYFARNPIFCGAYEIANNQVVVAIFEMQFTDEVFGNRRWETLSDAFYY